MGLASSGAGHLAKASPALEMAIRGDNRQRGVLATMNPSVRNLFDLKRLDRLQAAQPLDPRQRPGRAVGELVRQPPAPGPAFRRQGPRDPRLRRRLAPPPHRRGRRGHRRLPGRPPGDLSRRVRPAPALSPGRLEPRRPDLPDAGGPPPRDGLEARPDRPLGPLRRREPAGDGGRPAERVRHAGQVGLPPRSHFATESLVEAIEQKFQNRKWKKGVLQDPPGDGRPLGRRPPGPGPAPDPADLGLRRPGDLRRRRLDPGGRPDAQGATGRDPQVRPRPPDREVEAGQHADHPVPPRPAQGRPADARPGPVPRRGAGRTPARSARPQARPDPTRPRPTSR